jgi:hypothetical protein
VLETHSEDLRRYLAAGNSPAQILSACHTTTLSMNFVRINIVENKRKGVTGRAPKFKKSDDLFDKIEIRHGLAPCMFSGHFLGETFFRMELLKVLVKLCGRYTVL